MQPFGLSWNGCGDRRFGTAYRDPVNTGLLHHVCASFALPQYTSQGLRQGAGTADAGDVRASHPLTHAQCDFGEAVSVIGGVERKADYFVLDLLYSDGCFVKAYPAETTEALLDGHVSASAFLGGVPQSILFIRDV